MEGELVDEGADQVIRSRVQLAGLRTTAVEYRRLTEEVVLVGTVEPAGGTIVGTVRVRAAVAEKDVLLVTPGRIACSTPWCIAM